MMSEIMEEIVARESAKAVADAKAEAKAKQKENVLRLLSNGKLTVEEIAEVMQLNVEEVKQLQRSLMN